MHFLFRLPFFFVYPLHSSDEGLLLVVSYILRESAGGVGRGGCGESGGVTQVSDAILALMSPCQAQCTAPFLSIRSIPFFMRFISYFSWFTYGNEMLLVNQWTGVTNITCSPTAILCYPDGATILQQLNFSPEYFVRDMICLCCLTLMHLVAAYVFFHLRTLRSKARR